MQDSKEKIFRIREIKKNCPSSTELLGDGSNDRSTDASTNQHNTTKRDDFKREYNERVLVQNLRTTMVQHQ
jgi:hypothetical protein